MRTVTELAALLAARRKRLDTPKLKLAADAGITPKTLGHVLSGEQDFKVSTLLAVADRLGLEVMLVPKGARGGVSEDQQAPRILTRVQAALGTLEGNES
jgi:transcriptional regulator with XRE-family HTH domain